MLKYIFVYFFIHYWLACAVHIDTCFDPECDQESWYIQNLKLEGVYDVGYVIDHRLQMVYYVASIFYFYAASDRYQYTVKDTIFAFIISLIGYYLVSFYFSELCAYIVHKVQSRVKYIEKLINISNIIWEAQITSSTLRTRVLDNICFQWDYNHDVQYTTARDIFNDCPTDIKVKITDERLLNVMKKCPLFQGCDQHFLRCLVSHCKLRLLPPNYEVAGHGLVAQNIHLIIRGYVLIQSQMAGDEQRKARKVLTSGDSFGIVELLHNINFLVEATTITVVEMCNISRYVLLDLYKGFPEENKILLAALNNHLNVNRNTLLRLGGRLQPQFALEESLGQADYFNYVIFDTIKDTAKEQYIRPFKTIGKWACLRFVLLRTTINPMGRFYVTWEFFRCVCILIPILALLLEEILVDKSYVFNIIEKFTNSMFIPDLYIRLHLQFYNEKGIKVTHPLYTAKHYLRTNLVIDVISPLPMLIISVKNLDGALKIAALVAVVSIRLLQYYRIVGLLNMYQNDAKWNKTKALQLIKYFAFITIIVATIACVNEDLICEYKFVDNTIKRNCEMNSWLGQSIFKDRTSRVEVFVYSLYIVVISFTGGACGLFRTITIAEVIWFLILYLIAFMIRWFMLAAMASLEIVGNTSLITYRGYVKAFAKFMDNEVVDEALTEVTVKHFEHVWKRTRGIRITQILQQLHTNLHRTIAFYMYGHTLENIKLFSGLPQSFLQMICVHVTQMYFRMDSEIIRCNDVQNYVYFIHKGKVDIVLANFKIATLGNGGAFGNFTKKKSIRQTIKVMAIVHTDVLVIDSTLFQNIVSDCAILKGRLQSGDLIGSEYYEPLTVQKEQIDMSNMVWKKLKWYQKFQVALNPENTTYVIFDYLWCCHIAPLATIVVLHFTFISYDAPPGLKYSFIYIYDFLFLIKVYCNTHVSYIDPDLGIQVTNMGLILKKYARTFLILDIISTVPLELIVWIFTSREDIRNYFIVNRALRYIYMVSYYMECKTKLDVSTALKWFNMTYQLTLFIEVATCAWYLAACTNGGCTLNLNIRTEIDVYVNATSNAEINILAYYYVINTFTTTGLRDIVPMTIIEIIISMAISVFSLYMIGQLTGSLAAILVVQNFRMTEYENELSLLTNYLEVQNLSPILLKTTLNYLTLLWKRQAGEPTPILIQQAPFYLKQDIMKGLYGKYVETHPLFENTHVDFIRQIVCFFKRCVFFPGNIIVEKGDMDGIIYFIHSGEVEEYEVMAGNYLLMGVLEKGACFGEGQGLFLIPHKRTYKAMTAVELVMLARNDWIYLLQYFPASKQEIENKAEQLGVVRGVENPKIPTYPVTL